MVNPIPTIDTTKKLADVAGVQKFKKKIQEQAKERQSEAGKEFGNGETKLTKIYHKLWMEM